MNKEEVFIKVLAYLRTESGCIRLTENEHSIKFELINPTHSTKEIHDFVGDITDSCKDIISLNTFRDDDDIINVVYRF